MDVTVVDVTDDFNVVKHTRKLINEFLTERTI